MPEKKEEGNSELTTSVDQLLNLLKKKKERISLEDAAKELGVGLNVVQSWVDFLVEEQIIGIEYKFTKPFIYLNEAEESAKEEKTSNNGSMASIREEFMKKAQEKNIPDENLEGLWKKHVENALEGKKNFFWKQASKRDVETVQELWNVYKNKFLGEHLGT